MVACLLRRCKRMPQHEKPGVEAKPWQSPHAQHPAQPSACHAIVTCSLRRAQAAGDPSPQRKLRRSHEDSHIVCTASNASSAGAPTPSSCSPPTSASRTPRGRRGMASNASSAGAPNPFPTRPTEKATKHAHQHPLRGCLSGRGHAPPAPLACNPRTPPFTRLALTDTLEASQGPIAQLVRAPGS